jgi:prepilin-type processing-associated H-X9-DG protein
MRRIIGTIGATLAVVAVTAVSAAPASAGGQDPGLSSYNAPNWSAQLPPYIEQDNLFRSMGVSAEQASAASRHAGGSNFVLGDGSVRFVRVDAVSLQTWRAMGSRMGGEVLSPD